MNPQIIRLMGRGDLILLLGAGASKGSLDSDGSELLDGESLASFLAKESGFDYEGEGLNVAYNAAKSRLGTPKLAKILEGLFRNCRPSSFYETLARYPWKRVYTLNIDDAFERALQRHSPQNVNVRHKNDPIVDQDPSFKTLDYVKLNGSVDRLVDGLIFSPQEYGSANARTPTWYEELARDYFNSPFMFIGTKLREPVFYHQIERFRERSNSIEGQSYLLTPSVTELEKENLLAMKLDHIAGVGNDFSAYVTKHLKSPSRPADLAVAQRPELALISKGLSDVEREQHINALITVVPVSRTTLVESRIEDKDEGKIRDFYKGFKPRWKDILDEVPARFSVLERFLDLFEDIPRIGQLLVAFGGAGSGKTTLLMQSALIVHERLGLKCYYLSSASNNLKEIVRLLDQVNNNRYFIFSDFLDLIADQVVEVLKGNDAGKVIFVASERQHIYETRVRHKVNSYVDVEYTLPLIGESDAREILKKLENYGPWTRLKKMRQNGRVVELVKRSRRQLLIGLMEATQGKGFEEIIKRDFRRLADPNFRKFVIAVGLATIHRLPMKPSLLARVLERLNIKEKPSHISGKLGGIAASMQNGVWIRHPVYVRFLFENEVPVEEMFEVVVALMEALSAYEAPVIRNAPRTEGQVFRHVLNHKFLRKIMRNDPERPLMLYQKFETIFSVDGLYWLQYGLALRDIDDQEGAYEKLKTAFDAYQMPHTEHALAQQMLILAERETSKERAFSLLEEASEKLNRLDATLESDDTYPIVALCEGHTQIVARFEGLKAAQKTAKDYLDRVERRFRKRGVPSRVDEMISRLKKYTLSGTWDPSTDWL